MTDTQRLNFLEGHRCTIYKSGTGSQPHWVVVDESAQFRQGSVAVTLRRAIDKAMPKRSDAAPSQGEKK